jgi:4-hydroxy-3-polyprenylbenzoate decarboxylase
MFHRSTRDTVEDLRRNGRLIVVDEPLSPHLEIAEVQRRVYARGGPAVLFTRPIGTDFPMVGNLFGSLDQARFLFRHTLDRVRRAIEIKIDPASLFRNPWRYRSAPWLGWTMLPKRVRTGEVLKNRIQLEQLPQLVSWPGDGGPFVTLPQVLSQASNDQTRRGLLNCNLGMYRVQLAGNEYAANSEIGLHYQIHRGIGVHHQAALAAGKPFQVAISVGGTPAMTLSAVMPLPEGMSELTFAGALAGHRIPLVVSDQHAPLYADADFIIYGEVDLNSLKPEGPFGDHLGYYSKQHPFPFLKVRGVHHRPDAIWPFTVVGRPPQEDTTFGQLIHELTGPIVPTVLPGIHSVHAVDAAGVHPLLLAIGSERYTPYRNPHRPQELLTQANAVLGQGQMSLAKYLMIINRFDAPELDVHNIEAFLKHLLSRIDWTRDLHFQTKTTIDTLDYSGDGFNQGSKVVMAASGPIRRSLATELPTDFRLPDNFGDPYWCLPGVLAVRGPARTLASVNAGENSDKHVDASLSDLISMWEHLFHQETSLQTPPDGHDSRASSTIGSWDSMPLVVVVDDAKFVSRSLENFLWTTFTRSNPASDIDGIATFVESKHWGCRGPLLIDARCKPNHAPGLVEDADVTRRIDALAARGGAIAKYL